MPDHPLSGTDSAADRPGGAGGGSGTFSRAKRSSRLGIADEIEQAERERPEMYGRRLARPDREQRLGAEEDLAVEDALEALGRPVEVLDLGDDDALTWSQARWTLAELRLLGGERGLSLQDLGERGLRRRRVGRAHGDSRGDLVVGPATRTMKLRSMFEEKIAQKLMPAGAADAVIADGWSTSFVRVEPDSSRFRDLGCAWAVLTATATSSRAPPDEAQLSPWSSSPSLASVSASGRPWRRLLRTAFADSGRADLLVTKIAQRLRLAQREWEEHVVKVEIG